MKESVRDLVADAVTKTALDRAENSATATAEYGDSDDRECDDYEGLAAH
jgi:hypothetical protein